MATLYVGRNNGIRNRLEYSKDGGKTYTPFNLSAPTVTSLRLVIYASSPGSPVLDRDAKGDEADEFDLSEGAQGIVEWNPGDGVITPEMAGTYNSRWILVDTDNWPQGLVIEGESVTIKQ